MEWPQITMIVLFCIRLYKHAENHGQPLKYNKYDFGSAVAYISITSTILYFGGFWG